MTETRMVPLTREEAIKVAAERYEPEPENPDAYRTYASPAGFYAAITPWARFGDGDQVLPDDSDDVVDYKPPPYGVGNRRAYYPNRGAVQEIVILSFPDMPPGKLEIGYVVEFPGPMGVGYETFTIPESQLKPIEEGATA